MTYCHDERQSYQSVLVMLLKHRCFRQTSQLLYRSMTTKKKHRTISLEKLDRILGQNVKLRIPPVRVLRKYAN